MHYLHMFLLLVAGISTGAAACGVLRRYPDKHTVRALTVLALVAALTSSLLYAFTGPGTCVAPVHVQAVWLDGAWRCITPEEAG